MDDFLQSLPLVQMLAHTSMRSRHWQQLMSLTNKHLAVGSDSFKLIHLLEADLLEVREPEPKPDPQLEPHPQPCPYPYPYPYP